MIRVPSKTELRSTLFLLFPQSLNQRLEIWYEDWRTLRIPLWNKYYLSFLMLQFDPDLLMVYSLVFRYCFAYMHYLFHRLKFIVVIEKNFKNIWLLNAIYNFMKTLMIDILRFIASLDLDLNLSSQVYNLFKLQISIPHALAFSKTSVAPLEV